MLEQQLTIIVLGVDRECELVDEEVADLGAALAGGEVQRGALVGVPHGGGDGGRALALLVERRNKLCWVVVPSEQKTNETATREKEVEVGMEEGKAPTLERVEVAGARGFEESLHLAPNCSHKSKSDRIELN